MMYTRPDLKEYQDKLRQAERESAIESIKGGKSWEK